VGVRTRAVDSREDGEWLALVRGWLGRPGSERRRRLGRLCPRAAEGQGRSGRKELATRNAVKAIVHGRILAIRQAGAGRKLICCHDSTIVLRSQRKTGGFSFQMLGTAYCGGYPLGPPQRDRRRRMTEETIERPRPDPDMPFLSSAVVGAGVWCAGLFLVSWPSWTELLVALAALVVCPLALFVTAPAD